MEFKEWQKRIIADAGNIGLRATARKYGFAESSCTSLAKIIKAHKVGDPFAGMRSWKRIGMNMRPEWLKNPSKGAGAKNSTREEK